MIKYYIMVYYFELLLALVFLLLNTIFVLIEFAIVKVRYTRIKELAQKGNFRAKIALDILNNINAYLAAIQLGITMASLALGWIGEPAFAKIIQPLFEFLQIPYLKIYSYSISFGVAFAIISALHIIIGEQMPKYIAISIPEKITLIFALPLKIFYKLTYYPMLLINNSANFIVKIFRIKINESEVIHSDDELRLILSQSEELGKISLGRLMMFEHLFDFGKTTVKEVMTLKDNIITLTISDKIEEIISKIKTKKFSRYPVLDENNIYIGFVHIKDIFLANQYKSEVALTKLLREIKYVNENITLERALKFFQENRIQIALVKGNMQEITGLITLEDIIEELTGEIRDEFESPPNFTLNQIFDSQSSIMELKSDDRLGAIQELIDKLSLNKKIIDKEKILNKIIDREKAFSTALGHQVAFPHTRIEFLKKPIIVVGKSNKGINFPSPDNMPIKVIFLVLTPFNDPTIQLKILSKLSKLISNITLRRKLLNASKIEQITEIFSAFENKIPEAK